MDGAGAQLGWFDGGNDSRKRTLIYPSGVQYPYCYSFICRSGHSFVAKHLMFPLLGPKSKIHRTPHSHCATDSIYLSHITATKRTFFGNGGNVGKKKRHDCLLYAINLGQTLKNTDTNVREDGSIWISTGPGRNATATSSGKCPIQGEQFLLILIEVLSSHYEFPFGPHDHF